MVCDFMGGSVFHGAPFARWHALRVRSNRELSVVAAFESRGVLYYRPTTTETTRWSDRIKVRERALFPGYLLIRIPAAQLADVLQVAGVMGFVGGNHFPLAIGDDEIEHVRRVVEQIMCKVETCPYVAGAAVTVKSGPLAGVSGVVVRTKGATRLVVSIEVLRRSVSVEMDAADVGSEGHDEGLKAA